MKTARERIISTIAQIILDRVIYPRIKAKERYLKHCIEFTDEYNEAVNVLDVLNDFANMMIFLKGENEND